VSIKIRFADFTTITRSKTLPESTDVGRTVYETAVGLYEALGLERARLRLVGVRVEGISDAAGLPHQLALGEKESGWREAEQAVDKASRRFGSGAVRPATLVEPGAEAPPPASAVPPSSRGKRDR
jgi:DNA polymerase-4